MNDLVDWANTNAGALSLLFALVVATTAVVTVWLNHRLVAETVALRKAETDPDLALFLEVDKYKGFFDLVLRNVGRGPAYAIDFRLTLDSEPLKNHDISRIQFLRDGIRYLAPDQELRCALGNFIDVDIGPIEIHVRYTGQPGMRAQSAFEEMFTLDINLFRGTAKIGDHPQESMARSLEQISKEFSNVVSGFSPAKVEVKERRRFDTQTIPIPGEDAEESVEGL